MGGRGSEGGEGTRGSVRGHHWPSILRPGGRAKQSRGGRIKMMMICRSHEDDMRTPGVNEENMRLVRGSLALPRARVKRKARVEEDWATTQGRAVCPPNLTKLALLPS